MVWLVLLVTKTGKPEYGGAVSTGPGVCEACGQPLRMIWNVQLIEEPMVNPETTN